MKYLKQIDGFHFLKILLTQKNTNSSLTWTSVFRPLFFPLEDVVEAADEEKSGDEEEEDESDAGPESVERTDEVVTKSDRQKSGVDVFDRTATTDIL